MKCRKHKKCNGKARPTAMQMVGLPVYQCGMCGRQFAVGKIPRKSTTKKGKP